MKIDGAFVTEKKYSVDDCGVVFIYKDEILRGINNEYVTIIKDLFDSGLISELIGEGLFPKTVITDYEDEQFSLILKHEKIEVPTNPHEWSFDMLKDAAITVLRIEEIANKYGFQLKDPHAHNINFEWNKPKYIDLGSFIRKEKDDVWVGGLEFYATMYMPLYLLSKGYNQMAYTLLKKETYGSYTEYLKLLNPMTHILPNTFSIIFNGYIRLKTLQNQSIDKKIKNRLANRFLRFVRDSLACPFNASNLKRKIKRLTYHKDQSQWGNYHDKLIIGSNERMKYIVGLIGSLEGNNTCLEIGSNQGKLALALLELPNITQVVATDYDEIAVNTMYLNTQCMDAKNAHIQSILLNPFERSLDSYHGNLGDRLRSDVVIMLAVSHHLILGQNLSIDFIVDRLAKLTNKYLVIEFMPLGLYGGDENTTPPLPSFYNEEWFKKGLLERFNIISREHIEKNRVVFFCELNK